jgi:hypothetical protein
MTRIRETKSTTRHVGDSRVFKVRLPTDEPASALEVNKVDAAFFGLNFIFPHSAFLTVFFIILISSVPSLLPGPTQDP